MAARNSILPPRYEEPRLIGRGGMGEIYLAHDGALDRTVAVKLLAERLAQDPELRRRFRREGLAAARLSGEPHVVTVFDVGEHDGRPFTVMEYLPGGTLAERSRSRPVEPKRALSWLAQAAQALDAAHAQGVVHRDVKPANLLFDASGRVQVVDFGIARLVDETLGLTAPGTVLGTAGYLAPEQALGQETTAASDRYALAVVAYELLTGGRPFERGSPTAEAAAHVHEPVPRASERGVGLPEAVDAVFTRGLAKDPAHRYPTATAFVEALGAAVQGGPSELPTRLLRSGHRPARPPAPLLLVGAVLLAAAGLGAALLADRGNDESTPEPLTVTQEVTLEGRQTTVVQTVSETSPEGPTAAEQLDAEEAAALNDQAYELMQAGRWEDALPLLERALPALAGTFSDDFRYEAYAEFNLGRTLAELDRCDEALLHLDRSKRLQGNRREIVEARKSCRGGKD